MTDQPLFFPPRPVSDLSDAELMTEWFTSPSTSEGERRFIEVVAEIERRKLDR